MAQLREMKSCDYKHCSKKGGIMRLKNKKTGEIKEFVLFDGKNELQGGATLKDLVKEWEDVPEEPKDFWFIDPEILIACESTDPLLCDKKVAIETMKQIGNYFDSREEAEKAVEKLKALTKLCKKGFEFNSVEMFGRGLIRIEASIPINEKTTLQERSNITDSLYLLFGGEE